MLVCGVDEAGRGCVLGSLVVTAVIFDDEELSVLPVADSKAVSKKKREVLAKDIEALAEEVSIVELTAEDINTFHRQGKTLNEMEVIAFTRALNGLSTVPEQVYLDAADVNSERFRDNILKEYKLADTDIELKSEHKADENYPVVAAASIVAKVKRDEIMSEIAPVSGYGDKNTVKWLKDYYRDNGELPMDARYFWKTAERVVREVDAEEHNN